MIEQPALIQVDTIEKISGPGARLKLAREARHISIEEVAKQLRLTPQRVGYIEADDYGAMGASAFAKGYLRGYARFLGMSEDEILQTFDELGLESAIQSKKPELIHEKITPSVNPRSARRIGYLLVLGAIVLLAYWGYTHVEMNKNAMVDKSLPVGTEIQAATGQQDVNSVQQIVPLPPASTANSTPAPAAVESSNKDSAAANANDAAAVDNDNNATEEPAPVSKKNSKRNNSYQSYQE